MGVVQHFESALSPAQHIRWDSLQRKRRACLWSESRCLRVKKKKATASGRESHPPDLTFPGKSRLFRGRGRKSTENLGEKNAWLDQPERLNRKGGGLTEKIFSQ